MSEHLTELQERAEAIRQVGIQHESDCGQPGIFSEVSSNSERVWTVVIEHYDEKQPLVGIGEACRYTARLQWHITTCSPFARFS